MPPFFIAKNYCVVDLILYRYVGFILAKDTKYESPRLLLWLICLEKEVTSDLSHGSSEGELDICLEDLSVECNRLV